MNKDERGLHARSSTTARRTPWSLACGWCALLFICTPLGAQNQAPRRGATDAQLSELARANLGQVAASAAEIKSVLVRDAGLMVELKEWIADDATEHGQMVEESDLTDDAIFNRLETDVRFRSLATRLLQHYGYFVPSVNPSSEQGREQALMIEERVKWLAQEDEEERAQQAAQAERAMQTARACAASGSSNCARQKRNSPHTMPLPQPVEEQAPPGGEMNSIPSSPVPAAPPMSGGELEHAGLTSPDSGSRGGFLGLAAAINGNQSPDGAALFGIGGADDSGGTSEGISSGAVQKLEQEMAGGEALGPFGSGTGGTGGGLSGVGGGFGIGFG